MSQHQTDGFTLKITGVTQHHKQFLKQFLVTVLSCKTQDQKRETALLLEGTHSSLDCAGKECVVSVVSAAAGNISTAGCGYFFPSFGFRSGHCTHSSPMDSLESIASWVVQCRCLTCLRTPISTGGVCLQHSRNFCVCSGQDGLSFSPPPPPPPRLSQC